MSQKKISNKLLYLDDMLDLLVKLHESKKLPRSMMISGKKGCGKFTLITHFMNCVFDKKNYDYQNKKIFEKGVFYKQYLNNIYPSIIYLSGNDFKGIKLDDIRNLKSTVLKTSILKGERFIIFDDVELLNIKSFNALLKLIEEPTSNNHFILINNQTKPIIETIHSRCIEFKVILKKEQIKKIIETLIANDSLEVFIDYQIKGLTPGNFLSFNKICEECSIDLNDDYLKNIVVLLNSFKKFKNKEIINLILFLTDYHFYSLKNKDFKNNEKIFEQRNFVIKNMNNFVNYNINQNSLISVINNKLLND